MAYEIGQILIGIAWPSVTLIIVFAFRKQIANSTPALLNNIKKLKYGKFEAEFDRVYKEAQKLELPEVKRVDELDIDITTEIVDEYRKLAEVSPRITIMQAWMSFEKTVLECFEELSSKSVPSKAFDIALSRLADDGIVANDEIKVIKDVKQLRNLAAHEIDFKISPEKAVEYAILLSRMETKIVSANLLDGTAKEMLLKAVEGDGKIVISHNMREYCIHVDGENIIPSQEQRDVALWENALEDLEESDFVVAVGDKREVFKVTSKGYKYTDRIKSSGGK